LIVPLRDLAFARSGDKGDTCSIGVVPYDEADIDVLRAQVTVERVRALFGALAKGPIHRYDFLGIKALNFVLERCLDGGVSRSLNMDIHGKTFASLMLTLPIDIGARNVRPDAERPPLPAIGRQDPI
jgi:hypothetical protein